MASKVSVQCFGQQETSFLIDESGYKLQAKSMVMCQSNPYVITEDGDIDLLWETRWRTSIMQMTGISNFLGEDVMEPKAEKSQSFLGNMFRFLIGSRWRTRHRQLTGIPLTPITLDLTRVMDMELITIVKQPAPSETEKN